jgi:transcriptional regulator with XRE-family HTH domain
LQSNFKTRTAYIQAKVGTLVPSQIRALRIKSETPRQPDLAKAAEMHQSRISMLETAGSNPTLGTLSAIAAALKVGLKVEFVPLSEMLAWENEFSQDDFTVVTIDDDAEFLNPQPSLSGGYGVYLGRVNGTITGLINGSLLTGSINTMQSGVFNNADTGLGYGSSAPLISKQSWNSYAGPNWGTTSTVDDNWTPFAPVDTREILERTINA